MWRKGNPHAPLVGMQIGETTMENSVEVPQKCITGSALQCSNSPSGYTSDETQNTNSKAYMHLHVHCSIIYNSKDMEATQVHIDKQTDKKLVVHVHY